MPAHVRDRVKPSEVADGQTLGIPKPKVLVPGQHDSPWTLYSLVRRLMCRTPCRLHLPAVSVPTRVVMRRLERQGPGCSEIGNQAAALRGSQTDG